MIPRDVTTHWNSTFDMLDFCLTYAKAIRRITEDSTLGLRQYELSDVEWVIAGQLQTVLQVSNNNVFTLVYE